jgi:hypothetical protein
MTDLLDALRDVNPIDPDQLEVVRYTPSRSSGRP